MGRAPNPPLLLSWPQQGSKDLPAAVSLEPGICFPYLEGSSQGSKGDTVILIPVTENSERFQILLKV